MSVTPERVAFLSATWREATDEDSSVQTVHRLAPQVIEETLLVEAANAQSEATRRQALRGVKRDRFELLLKLDDETVDIDLGDVAQLTHSRYDLSSGKKYIIIGLQTNTKTGTLLMTIWG